jgi:alpha-beta hydrolase superfamily lysophospholipase
VYIDRFDDYLNDLDIFMKRVRELEPGRPVFLFGHSMGGAIVTLYTITHRPDLAGLLLSAAALEVDAPKAKVAVIKAVAGIAPRAGVFQLDLKDFSRDPEVVKACGIDPLVYQKPAPARTAKELVGAVGVISARMEEVTVPLLAMHGTADKVTPPHGSQELTRRAASSDKTLKQYEGLYHDLVHEPEQDRVRKDIVEWVSAHIPVPATARP